MPATDRSPLVYRVAAYGLAGATDVITDRPLADDEWTQLYLAAGRERIAGHLAAAVATGALPATEEQRDAVDLLVERAFAVDLAIEAALIETIDTLADASIDARVLKGPALAHLTYPEPGRRSFGDVDLLVRGDDFSRAVTTLRERGGHRRYAEPRPGFDRRFGKGACIVRSDQLEVDLHRTFVAGPFGLALDVDDLWSSSQPFEIGGRALVALDTECRFLHACYHVVLGDVLPRVPALRDVAEILERDRPDEQRILDLATRWRGTAVVARALDLASELLAWRNEGILATYVRDYEPTRFERRALPAYGAGADYAHRVAAGVFALDTPSARVSYAWSLLRPGRDYLSAREGTYWRRLRHGMRAVRTERGAAS